MKKKNLARYFIKLAYFGSAYHGWQIQDNTEETVQNHIQRSISKILNESIDVTGCGRTDTGVHAREFYAHFDSKKENLHSGEIDWVYKFNCILPQDIAISGIYRVKDDAHARFDALSREYEYLITLKRDPFLLNRALFLHATPDITQMNKACTVLFEYLDFSCFSKSETQVKTNNCKIMEANWRQEGDRLVFTIKADRFLRNMVRAIVGTMLDVGSKKIDIDALRRIIESKNRSEAGISVFAGGLYLNKVSYPELVLPIQA